MVRTLNSERLLFRLQNEVETLTQRFASYSQEEMRREVVAVRDLVQSVATVKNKFDRAFTLCAAATNVALTRCYGKQFYPCQLLAGHVIAAGKVAEMATGEGKTIVTLLPVVWHAFNGRHVHVATANEYLAERDCRELQPVLSELGISTGLTLQAASENQKRKMYHRDVVFGAGSTFGFDYLKDQMTRQQRAARRRGLDVISRLRRRRFSDGVMQPVRNVAVIDEADSLLLDEAVTPLVLSGAPVQAFSHAGSKAFSIARSVAESLESGVDFVLVPRNKQVHLTQTGWDKIHAESMSGIRLRRPWNEYVTQALRAAHVYHRNAEYVVKDDKVQIVDAHTGRIQPDRMWQDGLHQSIECSEQVPISPERSNSARMTRQHFYGLYSELSGMTGTAASASAEIQELYDTEVAQIPLHRPSRRQQLSTRWFVDTEAKHAAIAVNVRELRQQGRAILIGTATIEQSQQIAECLQAEDVEAVVLNGLQDADEAEIIAHAGESGRVTIATNMAGRGTDIRPDAAALQSGGLHVIATQHNESARVDRQLIGRCARQGEPGSYQFYISAVDSLIADNASEVSQRMLASADQSGECTGDFSSDVSRIQSRLEDRARIRRKSMLDHEQWMETVLTSVG